MRIVSIAPSMPFPGIAHAGGEYYRRHAQLLAARHQLVVVSPESPENRAALSAPADADYLRLLVAPRARLRYPGRRLVRSSLARAFPFLAFGPFHRGLLADPRVRAELESADRVELQWFRSIVLAPRLRRLLPSTPMVGVFHDVVSQGYARRMRAPHLPFPARALSLLRLLLAIPLERRAMRALDTAVVLSEKDEHLLPQRPGSARVVVVSPPLDDEDMPTTPPEAAPSSTEVLFVGALWRAENDDAARWLLGEIWPRVRQAVPSARLTIAGTKPSAQLQRDARGVDGVEVTGYVPSLSPYYRRAALVVSPLRLGAGLKFKSIVAMLWGVPVVGTSVAAEGMPRDHFLAVVDDAASFAAAVGRGLTEPDVALEVARRAFSWAHAHHAATAYRRALDELYA